MDWTKLKAKYGKRLLAVATALAAALLGALAQWLGAPAPEPVVVEKVVHVEKTVVKEVDAAPPTGGWVNDPDEVQAVLASLPIKTFGDTPAGHIAAEDMPKFVFGWKAYEQLLGKPAPIKDQNPAGTCVSFGTNTAIETTLAAEILRRKGSAAEWTLFSEEVTYAGSRIEIGGGRIKPTPRDPHGDGSVGAWAAQFVTKWGCVPRKNYPDTADLTKYDYQLARKWGHHASQGVPTELEAVARKYPVKSFAQVKVWEEAKAAMAQGYFVAICSNQGFTRTRDANGVARPSGEWGHCMALTGYYTDDRGREFGHVTNSWNKYFTGPNGWGEPQEDGFWTEASVVHGMLRQNDSWAFSGVVGFPARKPLDWNVNRIDPLKLKSDLFALRRSARPSVAQEVSLSW